MTCTGSLIKENQVLSVHWFTKMCDNHCHVCTQTISLLRFLQLHQMIRARTATAAPVIPTINAVHLSWHQASGGASGGEVTGRKRTSERAFYLHLYSYFMKWNRKWLDLSELLFDPLLIHEDSFTYHGCGLAAASYWFFCQWFKATDGRLQTHDQHSPDGCAETGCSNRLLQSTGGQEERVVCQSYYSMYQWSCVDTVFCKYVLMDEYLIVPD